MCKQSCQNDRGLSHFLYSCHFSVFVKTPIHFNLLQICFHFNVLQLMVRFLCLFYQIRRFPHSFVLDHVIFTLHFIFLPAETSSLLLLKLIYKHGEKTNVNFYHGNVSRQQPCKWCLLHKCVSVQVDIFKADIK